MNSLAVHTQLLCRDDIGYRFKPKFGETYLVEQSDTRQIELEMLDNYIHNSNNSYNIEYITAIESIDSCGDFINDCQDWEKPWYVAGEIEHLHVLKVSKLTWADLQPAKRYTRHSLVSDVKQVAYKLEDGSWKDWQGEDFGGWKDVFGVVYDV